MVTLKQINKEITKYYEGVELVKGKGYFYISGANLKQSGIYVNRLSALNMQGWIMAVKELMSKQY